MNKKQSDLLQKELEYLIGAPLLSVTRSADALCLSLGPLVNCPGAIRNENGKLVPAEVARNVFALEISCCYRIVCGNEILLAKSDLYQPAFAVYNEPSFTSLYT